MRSQRSPPPTQPGGGGGRVGYIAQIPLIWGGVLYIYPCTDWICRCLLDTCNYSWLFIKGTEGGCVFAVWGDPGLGTVCVFTGSSISQLDGVCSTDLRLDTSTNGLKQVYTSLEAIYWKTYFLNNVHLKIIYNFQKKRFCHKQLQHLKMAFYLTKCPNFQILQYFSN